MTQETDNQKRGRRRLQGVVVRRSGDKTISVEVSRLEPHPMYGKNKKITKKYLVHDESNKAEVGQEVTIIESRPFSRTKRFVLAYEASKS